MNGKRKPLTSSTKNHNDSDTDEELFSLNLPPHPHTTGKYKHKEKLEQGSPGPPFSLPSPGSLDSTVGREYDDVASPGGSSTSSGPVYIRKPGFEYHGHAIRVKSKSNSTSGKSNLQSLSPTASEGRTLSVPDLASTSSQSSCKKKKGMVVKLQDISCSKGPGTASKPKPKKDPLPMKLRALPQSFWQQPNNSIDISPAFVVPVLPPLFKQDCPDDVMEVRPVTPPEEREKSSASSTKSEGSRIIRVTNSELLFKLFEGVDEKRQQAPLIKRGRPKKTSCPKNSRNVRDEDPCLVSTATESLLPLLPTAEKAGGGNGRTDQQPVLSVVSFNDGEKTISLPALNIEQNHSQVLSELVVRL